MRKPAARIHRLLELGAVATAAALLGACSGGHSSAPSGPTVSQNVADDAELVADRDAPEKQRIQYPVEGAGDPSQNWGDLYLPAGKHKDHSVPLVVLIHGGSWASQLGAESMGSYAEDLVERGMAVYNVEYRRVDSGGGWPQTFSDVASALDHVVELNKQFPEFTTEDELVVGHSAGAQLAMWSGTRHRLTGDEVGNDPKFRPTRVVSLAGPLDMVYAAQHGDDRIVKVLGGTPEQVPDRYTSVDPIQNIDPHVPVVAIHGTADTMVSPKNSERYIDAVDAAGGSGDLVLAEGDTHVSVVDSSSKNYRKILDIITDTSGKTVEELEDAY
ncbi:alpha/beta hydrolase family protein [Dietzia sp.]|uniref:alpha/beta hydrolase family protein n=1 Tax=Dietzia sp. TaxID=1871616 RepID=UPI002FD94F73